jgi:hypothetical protein
MDVIDKRKISCPCQKSNHDLFVPLEYQTMDKVQKPSNPECYTPSSEPFRISFGAAAVNVGQSTTLSKAICPQAIFLKALQCRPLTGRKESHFQISKKEDSPSRFSCL